MGQLIKNRLSVHPAESTSCDRKGFMTFTGFQVNQTKVYTVQTYDYSQTLQNSPTLFAVINPCCATKVSE